ncbi:hypothetical protein Ae201684P_001985 [Aphanomyces euteiches]|nr:hypothetical protein Ae201684P_001985 [Aphanomyces euteiches]
MTFYDNNPIGRVINRYAEDMTFRPSWVVNYICRRYSVPSWELSRLTSITKSPVLNFLDEASRCCELMVQPTFNKQLNVMPIIST